MQRRRVFALETGAKSRIMRERPQIESVEQRADVQSGAANDHSDAPARSDVRERRPSIALVLKDVVTIAGFGDVDEVMRDARPFRGARLRRPDVHAAVELPRIG